jgi:hypothetical protein
MGNAHHATNTEGRTMSKFNKGDRVRIKKGVKPFGGRILRVAERKTWPNGRVEVLVVAPDAPDGPEDAGWYMEDLRSYDPTEVEELVDE